MKDARTEMREFMDQQVAEIALASAAIAVWIVRVFDWLVS